MLLSVGERISCALAAMAINDLGHKAISLTGSQAGIVTDTSHGKAKIVDIRAAPDPRGARGRPDRARRGVPGRLDRLRGDDPRPRRLRPDGGRARRCARRRRLRDLHRRRGRLHRRPAHRPRSPQAVGRLLRGDARAVGERGEGADAALGRVREKPWSSHSRPLVVQRHRGDARHQPGGVDGTADHLGDRARHLGGRDHDPRRPRPSRHRGSALPQARRRDGERGHDRPERLCRGSHRHLVHGAEERADPDRGR